MKELKELSKEELIKLQDIYIYFGCNSASECLFMRKDPLFNHYYSDIIELYNNDDMIKNVSSKNLLLMLVKISEEESSLVINEITERINCGENIFSQSNFEYSFLMFGYMPFWRVAFSLLPSELQNKVLESFDKEFTANNEFSSLIANCTKDSNRDYFINLYDNNLITSNALKYMQKMAEKDAKLFDRADFGMFQDEFLDLDEEAFFHILKYPNICKRLQLIKDSKLLGIFINEINTSIQNGEHISTIYTEIEELSKKFALYMPLLEKMSAEDAIKFGLSDYDNLPMLLVSIQNKGISFDKFFDREYEESPKFTIDERKEALCNKFFSISFYEAERLVEQYADFDKIEGCPEEKMVMEQLKRLVEITDYKNLDVMYREDSAKYDAKAMIKMESTIREIYSKMYIEKFNETRYQIKEQTPEYIEYNGKKIPKLKLTGEAHVLIHSSDTGFKGNKELKNESFKKTWEEKDDFSHHIIATTHVDNAFHGVAPINENGVYYVFLPDNSENLNLMGNSDIDSHVRSSNYLAVYAKFLTPNSMDKASRRVYQEFGIEDSVPDAIAIYDDMSEKLKENAYRAAIEFNIPIIWYSKREIAEKQKESLLEMIGSFDKSKDKNVNDLITILSTYETNKAGWLLNREEQEDDSLTQTIDNSQLLDIFSSLDSTIRETIENYIKYASQNQNDSKGLIALKDYISKESELYSIQNERKVPFAKTKMSDYLSSAFNTCASLIERYDITDTELQEAIFGLGEIENAGGKYMEGGVSIG